MSTIGLDLGTSRVKAVRFDDDWQAVDSEAETTELLRTAGGWCEQDMNDVWAAAVRVVRAVVDRTPDPVELLALTAQGDGCWLVDAHGEPVRPAILWNDNRGGPTIDQWEQDGTLERTFRANGCYGASGLAHAQLRWLETYEPQSLSRAARLLSAGSWIYQQLTGRQVLEVSDAANPFLDARTRTYDEALLDQFGLTDSRRLLPDLVAGPDRIAPLLSPAAAVLGLPARTPIGLAPYDVPSTAIGTGTTEVGSAFAVLGTTLCVGAVTDDPKLDRSPNGMTLPGVTPDRWLLAYATMTGTEVLDWTANVLGLPDVSAVLQLAGTAVPDSVAPLMLPYLSPPGSEAPSATVVYAEASTESASGTVAPTSPALPWTGSPSPSRTACTPLDKPAPSRWPAVAPAAPCGAKPSATPPTCQSPHPTPPKSEPAAPCWPPQPTSAQAPSPNSSTAPSAPAASTTPDPRRPTASPPRTKSLRSTSDDRRELASDQVQWSLPSRGAFRGQAPPPWTVL